MRNLPNGFLAAHVAGLIQSGEITTGTSAVAKHLGIGEFRAAEIRDQALEKISQSLLAHFPRPNHENKLKEQYR